MYEFSSSYQTVSISIKCLHYPVIGCKYSFFRQFFIKILTEVTLQAYYRIMPKFWRNPEFIVTSY